MKKEARLLIIYRCRYIDDNYYLLVVYRGKSVEEIAYAEHDELLGTILSMKTYGEIRAFATLDPWASIAAGKAGIYSLPVSSVIELIRRKRGSFETLCCIYLAAIKNKTDSIINICYPGASTKAYI